jgi:hypothetical protein
LNRARPPVARLEHAQHRGHALDGEHELARPLSTRGFQRDAQIAEIAQHRELHGGAALDMAAIGQKLARQSAGELFQPGGQQPLMAEGECPQDQALDPAEQRLAGEAARQGMGEMAGLALYRLGEAKLEGAIAAGFQQRGLGKPGREAPADDIRAPGERLPALVLRQPALGRPAPRGRRGAQAPSDRPANRSC